MPTKQTKKEKEEENKEENQDVLESLQNEIEELKKQNQMLLEVADKKALAGYYTRHKESLPSQVKIRVIDGNVVLGWKMVKDEVYKDPATMRWIEIQKIKVLLENEKAIELDYMDFVRRYEYVDARIISRVKEEGTNREALKVERIDTGQEYVIGIEYVN